MRQILLPPLAFLFAGCIQQAAFTQDRPPPDFPGRQLFVSPMGEPFRGGGDGIAPEEAWFRGVDKNGDGQLTLAEFTVDAARFFATLDLNHNGEIGPDEIDHYETAILPEVHSGTGMDGGDAALRLARYQSGRRHHARRTAQIGRASAASSSKRTA